MIAGQIHIPTRFKIFKKYCNTRTQSYVLCSLFYQAKQNTRNKATDFRQNIEPWAISFTICYVHIFLRLPEAAREPVAPALW